MSPDQTPSTKRRKIRKGTTSCWECKRRKVRCSLVDEPGPVCAACKRRGKKCLTQDLPDELSESDQPVDERIGRVEALIDRLVQDMPMSTATATSTPARPPNTLTGTDTSVDGDRALTHTPVGDRPVLSPTASDMIEDEPPRRPTSRPTGHSFRNRHPYADISRELHASLPSREDISLLCRAGTHISTAFELAMMIPYSEWENNWSDGTKSLMEVPSVDTHPVLLARYIFRIIRALQHLDFKKSSKHIVRLSDSPQGMSQRLAETAIRLVTTRDELLDTVEGLECVVIEACYHMNRGSFRPAWTSIRRAMAVAQVMCLHRPGVSVRSIDPEYKVDTGFLWYRLVQFDRVVCLFMGLPQGSMDRSMVSEQALASDTPLGRLERLHCLIASRILERNEYDPTSNIVDTLKKIDNEINRAAETMPNDWWMSPNLAEVPITMNDVKKPPHVVWDMLRLVAQIYHFGLINQLHIPFMLGFTAAAQLQEYSQATCVNASRDILSRYIAFRNFNRVAFSCRMADFFALTAALLLLLGHIRQHSKSSDFNVLIHQRQGDRAMIQKAISLLQNISWVVGDKITSMSADILVRLLDIEAEAAKGRIYSTQSIQTDTLPQEEEATLRPGAVVLRFCVPYFGKLHIVYEGMASDETTAPRGETGGLNSHPQPARNAYITTACLTENGQPVNETCPAPLVLSSEPWYTTLPTTARVEDFTFPGLDLAFFDNLARERTILPGDANTSVQ
ncbi:hypothetical protein BJX64DRAFT_290641 [Aspergillus heterothallicus]